MPTNISSNPPQIAVVGSGYWGENLIRNFHNLESLGLICDKDSSLLEKFKEQYRDVETCIALNQVLNRDDISGVAVATPAESHFNIAREALLAGKHVFVEKPLVLHEEEGRELIEIAKRNNLTLMVGHLLQYHPVFVKLKELANSGDLGRINYIYSHRLNLGKIRREENILWSFAPHDISMILSLASEEPDSVQTNGGNYLHKKIADVTTTHLEFPSGMRAHIFVSWLHPFKEQKLVVVGEKKMAVFDDTQTWGDKLLLYPHTINWKNGMPVHNKAEAERLNIPQDEPLRMECLHYLHCISNGQSPITDASEGLNVLRVLNASQKSLDSNGKKILLHKFAQEARGKPSIDSSIVKKKKYYDEHVMVDPTAIIDDGVNIGYGTKIWHFSHILSGSIIGEYCNIGQNVFIGRDVSIGNNCKIQNNVSVFKGVTLEKGVFCGPSMVFTNIYNPRAEIGKMDQVRPTLVRKGTTIGANATIICGVNLGKYSFVGAGSVVKNDTMDYELVAGNPAKHIGWICECGEKLPRNYECKNCHKKYKRADIGLVPIT